MSHLEAVVRIAIRKWGNSLAVRIPKALADMTDITSGSAVELTAERGCLIVTPVATEFTLRSLVDGITDENRHSEILTGRPRGREVW